MGKVYFYVILFYNVLEKLLGIIIISESAGGVVVATPPSYPKVMGSNPFQD